MLSLLRPRCHNGLGASRGAINFLVADQPERFGTSNLGAPAIEVPAARLDRALPSEGKGRMFESSRARQINQ
jgi:hypothetical protein